MKKYYLSVLRSPYFYRFLNTIFTEYKQKSSIPGILSVGLNCFNNKKLHPLSPSIVVLNRLFKLDHCKIKFPRKSPRIIVSSTISRYKIELHFKGHTTLKPETNFSNDLLHIKSDYVDVVIVIRDMKKQRPELMFLLSYNIKSNEPNVKLIPLHIYAEEDEKFGWCTKVYDVISSPEMDKVFRDYLHKNKSDTARFLKTIETQYRTSRIAILEVEVD